MYANDYRGGSRLHLKLNFEMDVDVGISGFGLTVPDSLVDF